jgi:hypothetical protein
MPGKIVKFDPEDFVALDQLARDRAMSFQELADEAFHDLLKKHHRPTDLRQALLARASAVRERIPIENAQSIANDRRDIRPLRRRSDLRANTGPGSHHPWLLPSSRYECAGNF